MPTSIICALHLGQAGAQMEPEERWMTGLEIGSWAPAQKGGSTTLWLTGVAEVRR